MLKESVLAIAFIGLIAGCAVSQLPQTETGQHESRAPVIVEHYAAQVIRPGTTWRIYLRAEDRDGDMREFSAILWQAGIGYYSTDFTRIKAEDGRELAGYLYLNTPADHTLLWDELELTLRIRDRAGNRSESVQLPLRFDYVPPQEVPEEWQAAAKHRLGAIMIDIWSSERYNSDGDEEGIWRH